MANDTALTPGRSTSVTFDVDQIVLSEPQWYYQRRGAEIGAYQDSDSSNAYYATDLKLWASGAWTLEPIAESVEMHEYADSYQFIIDASKMTLVQALQAGALVNIIQQEPAWKKAGDLAGMSYSNNIATLGDNFFVKRIPAGTTWSPAPMGGTPSPDETVIDIPMDRVGISNDRYRADQPFFIKWDMPGTTRSYPTFQWSFYFGQYCLSFRGDGRVHLLEYVQPSTVYKQAGWVKRDSWRYAKASQTSQTTHSMQIFPHVSPNGTRYISFSTSDLDDAGARSQAYGHSSHVSPTEHVYTVESRYYTDNEIVDQSPGHATEEAHVMFDIRRDLRIKVQISTLGYKKIGLLIDMPGALPPTSTNVEVQTTVQQYNAPGSTLTSTLQGASGAFVPGVDTFAAMQFHFAGDGTSTPILWGYSLCRQPVQQAISPGSFTGGKVSNYSFTGEGNDPTMRTGSLGIHDETGQLTRLANRGQVSCVVNTTAPNAGAQPVCLFSGFVSEPRSVIMGNPARTYTGNWRDYTLTLAGQWLRLRNLFFLGQRLILKSNTDAPQLAGIILDNPKYNQPIDATDGLTPWLVTDAIRYVLYCAGFPLSQIAIPNLPIRFWYSTNAEIVETAETAQDNAAELIKKWCRNYLGQYLIYDENYNAGGGAWTIIPGSQPGATPIAAFSSGSTGTAPPHLPGALGTGVYPILGAIDTHNEKPDFNMVSVVAVIPASGTQQFQTVLNWAYNYDSFQVPGSTHAASPNHPDYIGYAKPGIICDLTLAQGTPEETQTAVNWTLRRFYDFTCHTRRYATFTGPLVIIQDATTGRYRPLRTQDPVTIDGQAYIVESVAPGWDNDSLQKCVYQCIQPIATRI